jgi:hypothetical protein
MAEEPSPQALKTELETLRSEFGQLKTDMQNERVQRAEQYMGNMRNWMAIYTPTVSLVFLLFAYLGFRGYSDIKTNRDRVDAEATKVQKTAQDFYAEVGALQTQVKATSIATTGLQGAFTAYGLGQPTLFLSGTLMLSKNIVTTVNGANLGPSTGHLYVRVQPSSLVYSSIADSLPEPIEIGKESIREWKESAVMFVVSPAVESALRQAKSKLDARAQSSGTFTGLVGGIQISTLTLGPVLAFQVKTANGTESMWTPSTFWPIPSDK